MCEIMALSLVNDLIKYNCGNVFLIAVATIIITRIICKTTKEVYNVKSEEHMRIYEMRKKDAEEIDSNINKNILADNNEKGNSEK